MPLLILRYINALSYGKQEDAYTQFSIIISAISITWTILTYINSQFESQIDPVYAIFQLKYLNKINQKGENETKTSLPLPLDVIKTVNVNYDSHKDVQSIITIGSANEEFFKTIDRVFIDLDESYFYFSWGREPVDFLKALSNIILMMKDDSKIEINIIPTKNKRIRGMMADFE